MTELTLANKCLDDAFEVLYKNFFDLRTNFTPITKELDYPVDIYEKNNNLIFDMAVVGLNEDDIDIKIEHGNMLRVSYLTKESHEDSTIKYLHKSIARRKFNLGWKISSKYDLTKLAASMNKGLLTITIPFSKEAEPIKININK